MTVDEFVEVCDFKKTGIMIRFPIRNDSKKYNF